MTTPAAPPRPNRRSLIVLAIVTALAVGAGAYLLLRGDAPAAVDPDSAVAGLEPAEADADEAGVDDPVGEDADGARAADEVDGAASTDGLWAVSTELEPYDLAASTGTFVGYRIDEELANVGATQAVGRTPAVSGQLSVDGTTVSDALVEAELTQLASDRTQRDGRVATAFAVDDHPIVRFTTDAFELPTELEDGARIEVTVPGTLEVAGGATDVDATVTAERRGEVVVVTGSLDLALADVGVSPPTAALVLSVADTATVEWQLYLVRG